MVSTIRRFTFVPAYLFVSPRMRLRSVHVAHVLAVRSFEPRRSLSTSATTRPATSAAAAATSDDIGAPAAKDTPSTAKTIMSRGVWRSTRESPIASARPRAWLDAARVYVDPEMDRLQLSLLHHVLHHSVRCSWLIGSPLKAGNPMPIGWGVNITTSSERRFGRQQHVLRRHPRRLGHGLHDGADQQEPGDRLVRPLHHRRQEQFDRCQLVDEHRLCAGDFGLLPHAMAARSDQPCQHVELPERPPLGCSLPVLRRSRPVPEREHRHGYLHRLVDHSGRRVGSKCTDRLIVIDA